MLPLTTAEANDLLPQKATSQAINPNKLNYLVIGPPKWGKTTLLCSIPDALLLAFEQGHAFQVAHKMIVDSWDKKVTEENPAIWVEEDNPDVFHGTMTKIVEVLEASDRFPFIIIDTADMCAKMCLDYHLKKHGWMHAQDGGDYGKGHDIAQNTPFRHMIGRIMRTGRGIGFITHTQVNTTNLTSKKETSLPGGVFKFIHTQADVILHGSFGGPKKGQRWRDRILKTEGDESTLAGNRIKGLTIPVSYIVDPEDPWGQWCSFFKDENAVATAEENFRIAKNQQTDEAEAPELEAELEPSPDREQVKPKATSKKRGK